MTEAGGLAGLLATAVLLLGFVVLAAGDARACAGQAAVLAAAAAWQAWTRLSPELAVLALLCLAKALTIAPLLRRRPDPAASHGGGGLLAMRAPVMGMLALGVALVALAMLVVPRREALGLALSVMLLGLLTALRGARGAGVLGLQNGVVLAALALPGSAALLLGCAALLPMAGILAVPPAGPR